MGLAKSAGEQQCLVEQFTLYGDPSLAWAWDAGWNNAGPDYVSESCPRHRAYHYRTALTIFQGEKQGGE